MGADEPVVAEEATSARLCTLYAGAVESIYSKPLEIKQRIRLLAAGDSCLQCSVAPSRQISAESPTALPTSWAATVDCQSVKTATLPRYAMRPSVATVAGIGLVSLQAAGAAFQGAATLPARVAGHLPAGLPLSQDE